MSRKRSFLALLVIFCLLPAIPVRAYGRLQEHASEPAQTATDDKTVGGELAKETKEAAGEEEENENLKHSAVVRKLAEVTGLNVHQAHMVAIGFNFAVIVFLIYWFARKSVPAMMRNRTG